VVNYPTLEQVAVAGKEVLAGWLRGLPRPSSESEVAITTTICARFNELKGSAYSAFPSLAEVDAADQEQLGWWYRYLPLAGNEGESQVILAICRRFNGFTPLISKTLGWSNTEETSNA
jgi:hypothetical protein